MRHSNAPCCSDWHRGTPTILGAAALTLLVAIQAGETSAQAPSDTFLSTSYVIVETGQVKCYGNTAEIVCPQTSQPFYGQDGQIQGRQPSFVASADGLTVYDTNTGLTWQCSPDTSGDGVLNSNDKLTWNQAQARPAALNAARFGGYGDGCRVK